MSIKVNTTAFAWRKPPTCDLAGNISGYTLTAVGHFGMPAPDFVPGEQDPAGPFGELLAGPGYLPPVEDGYLRHDVRIEAGVSPNDDYWQIEYSALESPVASEVKP